MKFLPFIGNLTKDLFIAAVCISIAAAMLLGVVTPQNFPVIRLGEYQMASFESGLALYQHGRAGQFYSLSPFNDFLISADGGRFSLLTAQDYADKKFRSEYQLDWQQKLSSGVRSYFEPVPLRYLFEKETTVESVATQTDSNTITVTRTIRAPRQRTTVSYGHTIAYDPQDLVFDLQGNLYSSASALDYRTFASQTNTRLRPFTPKEPVATGAAYLRRNQVEANQIVIAHPNYAEYIVVTAKKPQVLWVNDDYRIIEVVDPYANPNLAEQKSTMYIHVFDSLDKIKEHQP